MGGGGSWWLYASADDTSPGRHAGESSGAISTKSSSGRKGQSNRATQQGQRPPKHWREPSSGHLPPDASNPHCALTWSQRGGCLCSMVPGGGTSGALTLPNKTVIPLCVG